MHRRILVVEDEEILRLGTTLHLKSFGYDVVGNFKSGEDSIKQCTALKPDLILMDIKLAGDIDGIETVRKIQEKLDVPVIYLSVYSDRQTIEQAKTTNPFRYMVKPFKEEELKFTIETAIKLHEQEKLLKKLEAYEESLCNIQGIIYRWYAGKGGGELKFFNDMLEKMTGYKPDELKKDVHFLIPLILTDDREKLVNMLNNSIGKKTFKLNYRIKNKDGKVRQFQETGKLIYEADRKINYVDGVIFDITENVE